MEIKIEIGGLCLDKVLLDLIELLCSFVNE